MPHEEEKPKVPAELGSAAGSGDLKILLVGGGSGGHITPLMAVAGELKQQAPTSSLIYVGKRGDNLADIAAKNPDIDAVHLVHAGKFRRYHGESWLRRVFDFKTILLNIRDAFYVVLGTFQAFRLLGRLKPDIIFVKGGFVGVPVGLAAHLKRIPFITHDSDTVPGLANRIIGRWATIHATGMPPELYNYPKSKIRYVGIPLRADFAPITDKLKAEYRQELNIPDEAKLLFIIGGGLGSRNVNQAVCATVPKLTDDFKDLYVVHGVGRRNEEEISRFYNQMLDKETRGRVKVFGYLDDIFRYSGAADAVVTRAGATNLAEFALQGKACVIVPSPFLTGGHQLKNAAQFSTLEAAIVLDEEVLLKDASSLYKALTNLLSDAKLRNGLEKNISKLAKPNAAKELAKVILEFAK